MSRRNLRIIGMFVWAAFGVAGAGTLIASRDTRDWAAMGLARFVGSGQTKFALALPSQSRLSAGDPIFLRDDGIFRQVGYIEKRGDAMAIVRWIGEPTAPARWREYRDRGTLGDVMRTLLPPEKRAEIESFVTATMRRHGSEVVESLSPLFETALRQSLPAIEAGYRTAVAKHREEIDSVLGEYADEIMEQRLLPVAKARVLPIVREHAEPVAEEIGLKLWDRAPVWRFAWSAMLDATPIPNEPQVRQRWEEFVETEAVPVLEDHADEIVTAVQRILRDVSSDEVVRAEIAAAAGEVGGDPQVRALVRKILNDTFVTNAALRQVWTDTFSDEDARRRLSLAGDRIEPLVRKIGDSILGTRDGGIDPDFARVLRRQILGKGRRWVIVDGPPRARGERPRIELASDWMPFPVVYFANPNAGRG